MEIRKAVADIRLRLGGNSDDFDILERQIMYWLDTARLALLREFIDSQGGEIPPSVTKRYSCQPITKGKDGCDNCEVKLALPVSVFDLPEDGGVAVYRPGGKPVDRRMSSGFNALLRSSRFTLKEGWYRIGGVIYLEGCYPDDIKFTLDLVPSDVSELKETEEYPAPEELMLRILQEAEAIGRRQLNTPIDINNDGKHQLAS